MIFPPNTLVVRVGDDFESVRSQHVYLSQGTTVMGNIHLYGHNGSYSLAAFRSFEPGKDDHLPSGCSAAAAKVLEVTRQNPLAGGTIDQHAPGAKLDAGKVRPSLVLQGMPRAILAVSEVATFGANKYSDGGWQFVPNGQGRYTDAQLRHFLHEACGQTTDHESEKLHLAHEAWNALARLELKLREMEVAANAE